MKSEVRPTMHSSHGELPTDARGLAWALAATD